MPITTTRTKQIWDDLIAEYTLNMFTYFKQVKFNKDGKMRSNRAGAWVYHHFPNLIKEWKKRIKEMGDSHNPKKSGNNFRDHGVARQRSGQQ